MDTIIGWITQFWRPLVEVGILSCAYYLLLSYIQDSGMAPSLKGMGILLGVFVLAHALELTAIRWILSHIFQISILGFLIVFQAELRRGLSRIGQSPFFKMFIKEEKFMEEIIQALVHLADKKVGALIAIERQHSLKMYSEHAMNLDAVLSSELLINIFSPNTPFHDGGAVVQGERVSCVGCLFPLSESSNIPRTLGTRHRAGLGLSEETDAIVLIVSEETGTISMAVGGKLERSLSEGDLRRRFHELFMPVQQKKSLLQVLGGR